MERSENILADDVVVGEGVALDIPSAGPALRVGSGIIDVGVLGLIIFLIAFELDDTGALNLMSEAQARTVYIVLIATMTLIVPVTIETFSNGKSLGKLIFGTRVVRADQGQAGFREALVRGIIGLVEIWGTGGALALLVAILDRRSRRIGDMAAGTMVIKERIPLKTPEPTTMPPYLANWASHADIRRLPTGLALGIRQFLHRQMTLSPGARESLAQDLAKDVQKYVYPGPPPQTPALHFLMAVSAERSRREYTRIQRNRKLAGVLLNEPGQPAYGTQPAPYGVQPMPPQAGQGQQR